MVPAAAELPATTLLCGHRVVLSVTRRRGAWAPVPTWLLPNGRRAWVRVGSRGDGPAYGCCILALTGHRPKVRTGSVDGRLAIRGTDAPTSAGARSSHGCLRAPVGTRLTIAP